MNDKRPLVSIIVPVYKVEEYLRDCLNSIASQTYDALEVILVDDGSPDNCGKICDDFAAADSRFRVIHKSNGGVADARNNGLDNISGDLIAFADSDDLVEPDWIETLASPFISHPDLDVSICGWYRHEGDEIKPYGTRYPDHMITGPEAFRIAVRGAGFDGYLWNKMFRASLFKDHRFSKGISICEDLLICCEIFLSCRLVKCDPKPLYHYMIRNTSALRTYNASRETEMTARRRIIELAESFGDKDLINVAKFVYVQSALTYVYKAKAFGKGLESSADRVYRSTRGLILPALFQNSVGIKARLRILAMYISPSGSMKLWFAVKKAFGIEYTKPEDR